MSQPRAGARRSSPLGGKVVRTAVGDRAVVEAMRRHGYNFGGEQSGHLIFLDHVTTGDGVAAALNVLAVMKREEQAALRAGRLLRARSPRCWSTWRSGRSGRSRRCPG